MKRLPLIIPSLFCCALTATACDGGKSEDSPKGAAAASADAKPADANAGEAAMVADAQPEPEGPKADPELVAAVDAVIANCEVDGKAGSLTGCAADEYKKLREAVKEDQLGALETVAVLFGDEDPNKVFVAATLLMDEYRTLGKSPEVDPVVARALVDAFAKTEGYTATRAAPAVAMAATATGDDEVIEAVFAAADANANEHATTAAYRYALRYGKTQVFPKIQGAAKSENTKLAAAAVQSYREVIEPDAELEGAVCPWADDYLEHEDKYVRQQAGWVAIRCGGEHIDALLEAGEKRLDEHQFTREDYMVYRDICFSFMGEDPKGSEAQCERNYAYLKKAADDADVDSSDRSLALFAIYYQRRNDETKKLVTKYKNHKDPELKKRAGEILESLAK